MNFVVTNVIEDLIRLQRRQPTPCRLTYTSGGRFSAPVTYGELAHSHPILHRINAVADQVLMTCCMHRSLPGPSKIAALHPDRLLSIAPPSLFAADEHLSNNFVEHPQLPLR